MRELFQQKLNELQGNILVMGSVVEEELNLALKAFDTLDMNLAHQVFAADAPVNDMRYSIEAKCFELIVTQQPAARDLRAIVAVMNMIVDLERMGDQAKGIAKIVPHLLEHPKRPQPPELKQMGEMVGTMLNESMAAYAQKDIGLAQLVANRDDEVDALYVRVFNYIMASMVEAKKQKKVEASYAVLRAGRELERFGDLATNVAERVIYIVTGKLHDVSIDPESGGISN